MHSLERPAHGVRVPVRFARLARLRIRVRLARSRLQGSWEIYRMSRLGQVGLLLIAVFGFLALIHPILIRTVWPRGIYDPEIGFDPRTLHPSLPTSAHWLGTDVLGRDVLSMLLAATTPTFVLGLTAALGSASVGTLVGGLSGYFRGFLDAALSRVSDVFLLLPAPILMVIIGTRYRDLGPLPLGLMYGLFAGLGNTSIVLRSVALRVRELPFIEASKTSGGSPGYILFRHVIPAMLPMAALQMMIAVTGAVVADGFISFFGFTRVIHNWGTMVYNALTYGAVLGVGDAQWHVLIPPSLALSLFALAFYLTAQGLHRVADPRQR